MQFGHCGIPLSIKGGPSHDEQRRRRDKEKGGEASLDSGRSEKETYKIHIL
jgi:hypothetical protein